MAATAPSRTRRLPEGAGDDTGSGLPKGPSDCLSDARLARFVGAAPPPGHGPHRYVVVVHALDVDHIGTPATWAHGGGGITDGGKAPSV